MAPALGRHIAFFRMAAMKEPAGSMSMFDRFLLGLSLILGLFAVAVIVLTMPCC
jgi:hypothetical protein